MIAGWRDTKRDERPLLDLVVGGREVVGGIGIVIVSLAMFWKETFNCLPDFRVASRSGAIGAEA